MTTAYIQSMVLWGDSCKPQGHVQVLLNMLAFKMTPQAALDAPRICIGAGMPDAGNLFDTVYLEEGISEKVADKLRKIWTQYRDC